MRDLLVPCLVAFLCAAALACSLDDPSGVVGEGSGSSLVAAAFDGDEPSPGPLMVTFAEAERNGDLVTVRVDVTDVDDMFGADLGVAFDPALVEYVTWGPGTLLGSLPIVTVAVQSSGHLVVGAFRQGSDGAVDVAGTQTLMTLTFRALAVGSSRVDVEDANLLNPPDLGSGTSPTIPGLTWFGGTLVAS